MTKDKRKNKKISEMNTKELRNFCKRALDLLYNNTTDIKTALMIHQIDKRFCMGDE